MNDTEGKSLFEATYNPDVLLCLANLSNDEVITPPDVANNMLDMLPQELFEDPNITFLDPCCKSGVFLREIAKRLIKGLEKEIPNLQERIDHIMHKQLYGIAITELTSLLSRRSLYCSKYPNSKYSISRFDNVEGNIRFKRVEHTFKDQKCIYCGASQGQYDRGLELETHAYELIHIIEPKEIMNMKFDVIIGNPPYQLETSGSVESQAIPIYNKFIEQAKKLNPKYLSMIIPSRWMNGGFGLDNFRNDMLNDKRIRELHDYLNASDCFPGIALTGGVCYFLWDRDNQGKCHVITHKDNDEITESNRYLLEDGIETFIRYNEAISILKKVLSFKEDSFSSIVSQRDPYGLNYYENGRERMFKLFLDEPTSSTKAIYSNGWQKQGIKYAESKYITTNKDAVGLYKVYISKANGAASSKIPYSVLSKPFIGKPDEICNMTYLMIGPFNNSEIAENVKKYISTKFFRFLVSLMKNTQNAYKKVYTYVPMQDFSKNWTDEELYKKYGLTSDEIDFIENLIKEMDLGGDE